MYERLRAAIVLIAAAWAAVAAQAVCRAAAGGALAEVRLYADPVVEGREIRLGGIAEIETDDPLLRQALEDLRLGAAPLPGAGRRMHTESLRVRMRQAGLPADRILIEPEPAWFEVQAAAAALDVELVREAVARALGLAEGETGLDGLSVVILDMPLIQAPAGHVDLRVRSVPGRWTGPLSLPVEVWVDGRLTRVVSIRAEVQGERRAPVARRDLPSGAVIRPDDISWESRPIDRGAENWLVRAEDGEWRTVRRVRQGEILTLQSVEPVPDAEAGQPVWIVAAAGPVLIEAGGILLEDAFVGEWVRVRNVDSGRVMEGILQPDGSVRVPLERF